MFGIFKSKAIKRGALTGGSAAVIATGFIAGWEGLRTEAYLDPVGIATVCYGRTQDVELGDSYTTAQCEAFLQEELREYLRAVDNYIYVPMPETRRAAFTSFAYNVGIANFKRSTLRRLMNEGQTAAACAQLKRWVFAKGIKLRGLVRRRDAEYKLCMQGIDSDV